MNTHPTRESWLRAAVSLLEERILTPKAEVKMLASWAVSVGWPLRSPKAIGQCFPDSHSAGKVHEMYISPKLGEAVRVLDVLLHEMVHAAVGCAEGHKGKFAKVVRAVGLKGKLTATIAEEGTELHAELTALAAKLGTYPHHALADVTKPKEPSKWFLLHVRSKGNPEYKFTIAPRLVEEYGLPLDPDGDEMEVYDPKGEG